MSDGEYDVVIIGAGPVGGYLAWKLSERNQRVLLIEEHDEIGRPFQCAGLINPTAMEAVGLYDTVLTPIWGARLHSPNGITIEIGNPDKVRTWSVCRKLFDEAVVKFALQSGADLLLGTRPIGTEMTEDGIQIQLINAKKEFTIKTRLLCGADGAHSWVRRAHKMGRPKELMIGFQIEVTGYPGKDGILDMYTGSETSPGFFSWAIPSGETTRIGMWSKGELLEENSCAGYLDELMTHTLWSERFESCNEIGRFMGPIPSGILKNVTDERIMLFGDAGGFCKPTTGGGIGPGFAQVDLVIETLVDSLNSDKLDKTSMQSLNQMLDPMRKKQKRAKALRDAFLTECSDDELDSIFSVWAQPEVIEMINEYGEIENPVTLGTKMLREVPQFRKLAGKAMKAVLWS